MTYYLNTHMLDADAWRAYDLGLEAPLGEKPKPRSTGTEALMQMFGVQE